MGMKRFIRVSPKRGVARFYPITRGKSDRLLARLDSEYRLLINRRDEMLRLRQYFDSGFGVLIQRAKALQDATKYASLLSIAKTVLAGTAVSISESQPLAVLKGDLELIRQTMHEEENSLSKALNEAEANTSHKAATLARIRALASELVRSDSNRLECPVCRTRFDTHKLLQAHVEQPEPQADVEPLQDLRTQLQRNQAASEVLEGQLAYVHHCYELLANSQTEVDKVNITTVRQHASTILSEYDRSQRESTDIANQLVTLKGVGMSTEEYDALHNAFVTDLGSDHVAGSDILFSLHAKIEQQNKVISENQEKLGVARRELEDLQKELFFAMTQRSASTREEEILHDMDVKLASLETVTQALKPVGLHIELDTDRDLKDLLLRIQVTSDVLQELNETVDSEGKRNLRLTNLQSEKEKTENSLKRYGERNARCDKAISVLRHIVDSD